LHHVTLDRWSRGESVLHRRDARVKVLALAAYLVAVAHARRRPATRAGGLRALRLPDCWLPVARRRAACTRRDSAAVPGVFAFFSVLGGQPGRAVELVERATCRRARCFGGRNYAPGQDDGRAGNRCTCRGRVLVVQFIYRYLFVVSEQAHTCAWRH
jgi:hypothetical protein